MRATFELVEVQGFSRLPSGLNSHPSSNYGNNQHYADNPTKQSISQAGQARTYCLNVFAWYILTARIQQRILILK